MFYSRSTDFQGAGKAGEGVQVWRIAKLKPVKIKPEEHGTFYTGDSYIVLKPSSKASSGTVHDIFCWLGLDASHDEHGAAALKVRGGTFGFDAHQPGEQCGIEEPEKEVVKTAAGPFVGMTFCVTGTLSVPRKEVQQRILDAGGKIVGSV